MPQGLGMQWLHTTRCSRDPLGSLTLIGNTPRGSERFRGQRHSFPIFILRASRYLKLTFLHYLFPPTASLRKTYDGLHFVLPLHLPELAPVPDNVRTVLSSGIVLTAGSGFIRCE
jgi:hypothetical protein